MSEVHVVDWQTVPLPHWRRGDKGLTPIVDANACKPCSRQPGWPAGTAVRLKGDHVTTQTRTRWVAVALAVVLLAMLAIMAAMLDGGDFVTGAGLRVINR